MTIGEFVKQYREIHNLSMQVFADMCGLSKSYISILEKGVNPTTGKAVAPTIDTVRNIAKATNTNFDDLLKLLDDSQSILINAETSKLKITVNNNEKELIEKYRQLDADDQEEVVDIIDSKLRRAKSKSDEAAPKEAM